MSNLPSATAGRAASPAAPALLERHGAHLRAYLATLPGTDARRVEQAMLALSAELATGGELDDDPAVWLFSRARRQAMGTGPRGDVLLGEGRDGGEGEEAVEGEDPAVVVHRIFAHLTTKQQEALRLRWQFGFTLEEMARITGLSPAGMDGLFQNALGRIVAAVPSASGKAPARTGNPRLIAYALDEMGAAEKRAFVEGVADGKELLETAETIRRTVRTLTRILQNGAPPPRRRSRRGAPAGWIAVAVALVVGGVAWWWSGREGPEETLPRSEAPDTASEPGFRRENAVSWRTAGKRERRPGEAAWEKKPFGRGHGQSAGLVGDGLGGGDAPAEPGDEALADLEENPMPVEEQAEEEPVHLDEDEPEETPVSVITLAGGAGGGAGAAGGPPASPVGGSGAGAGSTFARTAVVPPGSGETQSQTPRVETAPKPPPAGWGATKRMLAHRGWPHPHQIGPGELLRLAPPESSRAGAQDEPVAVQVEIAPSPFAPGREVMRVLVQARPSPPPARPPANLVLAIDVSASMDAPNRLPLVREGVRLLAARLRPDDRVAVVTYAAEAREVRASAPIGEGGRDLRDSLEALAPEGRTNGHEGLVRAYAAARAARTETGLNAVILCTDGNFNLGETGDATLAALAEHAADDGIRLSVFGFGRSDRNDLRLERLARHGGGQSCYVNTAEEAERLLAGQIDGLLEPVAREVAVRVVFDPRRIADARIPGADGGTAELLPGRSLALFYEFERRAGEARAQAVGEFQLDFKVADGAPARRLRQPFGADETAWTRTSPGFRFAVALAELERILQGEAASAAPALERLEAWTKTNLPDDAGGYRRDLLDTLALARNASRL